MAYASPLIETITANSTHMDGAAYTMRTVMMRIAGKSISVRRSPSVRMTNEVPSSENTNETELAACGHVVPRRVRLSSRVAPHAFGMHAGVCG